MPCKGSDITGKWGPVHDAYFPEDASSNLRPEVVRRGRIRRYDESPAGGRVRRMVAAILSTWSRGRPSPESEAL